MKFYWFYEGGEEPELFEIEADTGGKAFDACVSHLVKTEGLTREESYDKVTHSDFYEAHQAPGQLHSWDPPTKLKG
jgi:hypothetical protein